MSQSEEKLSTVAFPPELDEIKEVAEQLSGGQSSVKPIRLDVFSQLCAPQRRSAIDIIRYRSENGELDYSWLSIFVEVLTKLQAQQSQPELV